MRHLEENLELIITDGLIKQLEAKFGSHTVSLCDTWEKTCELKGQLRIINWLKSTQSDLKEEMIQGEVEVNINTS